MITSQIREDLKDSLKKGEAEKTSALRLVLAAIHNREIIKRGNSGEEAQLTDEEAVEVLRQEVKKRNEAAVLLRQGGREEMAQKEEDEAKIINKYLPQLMSKEEIKPVVDKLISEGIVEFSALMKESMKTLKGKADGTLVSQVVKEKLSVSK